jgi:transcriptional regulatory protein LevR
MFSCAICEEFSLYNLCNECRVIRHITTLNGKKRVLEVLENVFQRTESKQDLKMNEELKSEIENKKVSLKNSQLKRGTNLN